MAEATQAKTVTLVMSLDEAQAVRDVLAFVSGDNDSTRRRWTTSVKNSLDDAGVEYKGLYFDDIDGDVRFS